MSEPIDLNNVIEVNQIKKILEDKQNLIDFFNEMTINTPNHQLHPSSIPTGEDRMRV